DSTPPGQRLDLGMGTAAELRGERSVHDHLLERSGLALSESVHIRLHNSGGRQRTVRVREHLYRWTRRSIVDASQAWDRRDDDASEFVVEVPQNGQASIRYRVRCHWTEQYQ